MDITRELAPFALQVLENQIQSQRDNVLRLQFMAEAMASAGLASDHPERSMVLSNLGQAEGILSALEVRRNTIKAEMERPL